MLKHIVDENFPSLDEIDSKISEVLSDYYCADEKFCLSLSGGLDSRLLLLKFIEITSKKPETITYGTKNDRDWIISGRIVKKLALKRKTLEVKASDFRKDAERFILFSGGATSVTNSRAYGKSGALPGDLILINGFVRDLTFGGGFHKRVLIESEGMDFLEQNLSERLCKIGKTDFARLFRITEAELDTIIKPVIGEKINSVGTKGSMALIADKVLMDSKVIYDTYWTVLFSARKCRAIAPLSDPRLNEYFLSINSEKRYKHSLYKEYSMEKFPDFAKITWQKTGCDLYEKEDPSIINDKVNRRIPYQKFYKGPLKRWIGEMFFGKRSKLISIVDPAVLREIIDREECDNNWADFVGAAISAEIILRLIR